MSPSKAEQSQPGKALKPSNQMRLMGTPMAVVTEAHAVHAIASAAEAGEGHWTITANLDHLRRYHENRLERELIEEADLVVADGMPLIWASRLAGEPLPERVSGSSMVWSICEIAGTADLSLFLLGGDPGVAEQAAHIFQTHFPGLRIAGTACPSPGFEHDELQLSRLQRQVIEAAPQIVFVALGFPKQDVLIRRLRKALPGTSFLGVGISLSYVTGDCPRAPDWICNLGLEWAYRLAHEPTRRLARRYLIEGMPIGALLLGSSTRRRMRRRRPGAPPTWDDRQ